MFFPILLFVGALIVLCCELPPPPPISLVPTVNQGERDAIERQCEEKCMKKEVLRKKKCMSAQKEYASALTYIEMYHSHACWRVQLPLLIANKHVSDTFQYKSKH